MDKTKQIYIFTKSGSKVKKVGRSFDMRIGMKDVRCFTVRRIDTGKRLFLAMGYSGIDTREIGRASTKEEAQDLIADFKCEQVRSQGMVYWPMFWVHEEVPRD